MDEMNIIDQLLDPNNDENIMLYDEDNNPVEFEQIAIIPKDDSVYVLLATVTPMEGVGEDEGIVFVIEEGEDGEVLTVVDDDAVADEVFEIYNGLVEAEDAE